MAVESVHRDCPGPEDLAEYVEGTAHPDRRAAIEQHLLECRDCRNVLVETAAWAAEERAAAMKPRAAARRRRWPVGVIVAGLAAAAVLLLAVWLPREWIPWRQTDSPDRDLQALMAALREDPVRPSEGRLAGGFPYAPPPSPLRAAGDGRREQSPQVQVAIAAIERRAHTRPSIEADAALGVAYLVDGDLDDAIRTLEGACAARRENARCWNDLAVAYLSRGVRSETQGDFERAARAAQEAMKLEPNMPEAAFNLALATEHLTTASEARAAWEAARRLDPSSRWSDEAAQRAASLVSPP